MTSSLVGSEMCIRDSFNELFLYGGAAPNGVGVAVAQGGADVLSYNSTICLLYTSDAADDM
eukprot:11843774-Prorocentrum_lima.AAC.1